MAEKSALRMAHLIGQFPAINHFYLVQETRLLREMGWRIGVISVALADRPADKLRPEERDELPGLYCLKSLPRLRAAWLIGWFAFRHPVRFWRGLSCARRCTRASRKPLVFALFYAAEAVLTGLWMQRNGYRHLHASFTASVALAVARMFPVTMSFGVYGYGELYDPIGNHLGEKIASSCLVRSVSRHGVGQLMLSCPPQDWPKLLHIPLGIDAKVNVPAVKKASDSFTMLTVGRLSAEKGQRILLAALEMVVRSGRTAILHIVGEGPERLFLEAECGARGLEQNIVFHGWVEQNTLDHLLATTDAFVLSSLYEGIPIVLMEAMAVGTACIAPQINGVPELITHEKTGLLFAPADASQLASCILRLIDSPGLATELGLAAYSYVREAYNIRENTRILSDALAKVVTEEK